MKRGIKKMYVHSEMIAARQWVRPNDPDELDEITLSLGAKEGGCYWEFSINLERLSGRPTMNLKMWDDSWEAFREAPEVFEILRKYKDESTHRDDSTVWLKMIEDLEKAGWKHIKPEPRKVTKEELACPTCGHVK